MNESPKKFIMKLCDVCDKIKQLQNLGGRRKIHCTLCNYTFISKAHICIQINT